MCSNSDFMENLAEKHLGGELPTFRIFWGSPVNFKCNTQRMENISYINEEKKQAATVDCRFSDTDAGQRSIHVSLGKVEQVFKVGVKKRTKQMLCFPKMVWTCLDPLQTLSLSFPRSHRFVE